jgi:hypothetical protein
MFHYSRSFISLFAPPVISRCNDKGMGYVTDSAFCLLQGHQLSVFPYCKEKRLGGESDLLAELYLHSPIRLYGVMF